jgi:hypothetical protein
MAARASGKAAVASLASLVPLVVLVALVGRFEVSSALHHRLEPADGHVVHCGGSGEGDFQPYWSFLPPSTRPLSYMVYLGLDSLNNTLPGAVNPWFPELNATLSAYGPASSVFLVPQIGLSLPHDGKEILVANGSYDNAIHAFVAGLRALAPRPAYVRIGYEFCGPWNGYKPDSYVGAWKRIVNTARADAVVNLTVAFVWDRTCDAGWTSDEKDFYPGDDEVDWHAVNIYSDHSSPGDTQCVAAFVKAARDKGFPVMLGEVTPRGKNTSDASTWKEWFGPYFGDLLDTYDNIKHTSYINRAWNLNPSYKGWGDSRIQTAGANASGVAASYLAKMGNTSRFLNAMGEGATLAALGLSSADIAEAMKVPRGG